MLGGMLFFKESISFTQWLGALIIILLKNPVSGTRYKGLDSQSFSIKVGWESLGNFGKISMPGYWVLRIAKIIFGIGSS